MTGGESVAHRLDIELLAAAWHRNQAVLSASRALEVQRPGRLVRRGLALRVSLVDDAGATTWVTVMADVFSVRRTTVEGDVEPVAHEIKVIRAGPLSALRRPAKSQACRAAGQRVLVCREGRRRGC